MGNSSSTEKAGVGSARRPIKRLVLAPSSAASGKDLPLARSAATIPVRLSPVPPIGSMLSTPIVNPPQAAVLGLHNIVDRAVVLDGQLAIRPIMYLALSYDHRLIDGADSVRFLVRIKELVENPARLLLQA